MLPFRALRTRQAGGVAGSGGAITPLRNSDLRVC